MNELFVKLQSAKYIDDLKSNPDIIKVGKPTALYNHVIIVTHLTIEEVQSIPGVIGVEDGEQPASKEAFISESDPDGWALPWISDTNGTFEVANSGEGVDIYILDDGIRTDHIDFNPGQVETIHSRDGLDWYDDPNDNSPWHGTSVASCAAGQSYGIARDAKIYNLRIKWTVTGIIKALDVVLRHHLDKPDDRPSIINFSGSSASSMLGDAFVEMTNYGIVVVAAAGNYNEDIPRYPARSNYIIAIGAIAEDEDRAYFSNRRCDTFGPGVGVRCAGIKTNTFTHDVNGTSFSAPFYSALLACALEGSHKFNTSSHVSTFIFKAKKELNDRFRIEPFDNNGYTVRTMTSDKQLSEMPYYENPSFSYTDAEIAQFVNDNLNNPQVISDAATEENVSLKRLAQALGYTEEEIDNWFISHGVYPWWYVGE